MGQRGDFVPDGRLQNVVDVVAFFGRVVAGLGAFFDRPMKARGKARGADQPRRIFQKRIVVQNADQLGFNIGDAVERIEQQSARTFIQRQRHGVDGEIAAAQIFVNGRWGDDRRLARLLDSARCGPC